MKNKSNSPINKFLIYLILWLVAFSVVFLLRSIKRNSLCTYLAMPDYDHFNSFLLINLFISVAVMVPVALFFERRKIISLFKQPVPDTATQSFSTTKPVPDATTRSFSTTQKWQSLPKSKVAWGGVAAACILGIILVANHNNNGSGGGSRSSYSSSSHKSARQLIRDRAESIYGRRVDVTIDSGFYGGSYQVTVSDNAHFHNYTIAVTVDEANQAITSWETKQID